MPRAMSSFLDIPISALREEIKHTIKETDVISVIVDNKSELVSLSSKHNYKDQLLIPPEIKEYSDSFLKRKEQEENDRNIRLIEEKLNMRSIPVPIRPYLTDSYKREMDNVKHYFGEKEVYDISFFDLSNEDKDIILISNELHLDDWEKVIESNSIKFDKTINDIKKILTAFLITLNIVLIGLILSASPTIFISILPLVTISGLLFNAFIKDLHDLEYVKTLKNKKCYPINQPEFIRMNDLILPESKKFKTNFNTGKPVYTHVDLTEVKIRNKPMFPTNTISRY